MGDRCTGHCCRFFTMGDPVSLTDHLKEKAVLLDGEITSKEDEDARSNAKKLLDMLLYRGLLKANPLLRTPCSVKTENVDKYWHFWTCKYVVEHEDGTASCGNYENRPDMCKRFPYGKECEFPGCTWDEWKPKPNSEKLIKLRHRPKGAGCAYPLPSEMPILKVVATSKEGT